MKRHPIKTDDHADLDKAEHIAGLVAGYIRRSLNLSEHDELDEWISLQDDNMFLFEDITDEKKLQLHLEMLQHANISDALKKCKKKIDFVKKKKE